MTYQKQLLNLAKMYVGMGISVIPIKHKAKSPYGRLLSEAGWIDPQTGRPIWKPAQSEIAGEKVIKHWFGNGYQAGIALVGGNVSGNLIYLDWDKADQYREWALSHKAIVNNTAVSKTKSGYHVFFRVTGNPKGSGLYYNDVYSGEVRGEGMYVVAPPSYHPSGIQYRWLRHPKNGILTIEDLSQINVQVTNPNTDCHPPTFNGNYDTQAVQMCDEALILKAQNDINGGLRFSSLWNGDISAYQSQSEADLALCRELAYWTGRDPQRIDNLFRCSGLMRDKWGRRWGDSNYGQKTIDLACKSCNRVYKVRQGGGWVQI